MENRLQNYLIEGEKILWTGAPKFVLLDKTNKPFILAKAAIVVVAIAMFIAYYFSFVSATGGELKLSVFLVCAALAALTISPELLDARKLKNTCYAITDRRLISLIGANVESVEFSKIKTYGFGEDADGQISLLCGERAMAGKPRLRRLYTVLGTRLTEDRTACDSFVFYGIDRLLKRK